MMSNWRWGGVLFLLFFAACRPAFISPPPPPAEALPAEEPQALPAPPSSEAVKEELERRNQVAAAFTSKGRNLLKAGRVDSAIRLFEKALSQSSRYGPGYYYLAEAWLLKNSVAQAQAFHGQAVLYLHHQSEWSDRLDEQKKRIANKTAEFSIP